MSTEQENASKKKEEILDVAKRRFTLGEEYWSRLRDEANIDWQFRAGDQWPVEMKQARIAERRPVLTVNRLLQPIQQVTNDQRQNRPSIKVWPVDDKADIETAKIYQGLARHIENGSDADVAYDTAFEGASVGGFGFYRILTQYVDPGSFEQEIKIAPIEDPNSVTLDPNSKLPDGSDAAWAFVSTEIPKDDFIAQYGESKLAESGQWELFSGMSENAGWIEKDAVRIAEYFYKEYETKSLVQLKTGQVIEESFLAEMFPDEAQRPEVVNKRKAKVPVIHWCKINGLEILEETIWPGLWIPIIPCYGAKYVVNGKRYLEGIVRQARDPQRMYNYWKSTETETITLAPKAPFIAAEGQIPKQYEHQWKTANQKSHAYLTYKPTAFEGHLVPPPQRNFGEPPVQAITQAGMFVADDVKATTGIHDAAMGRQSNETSGRAIERRAAQAQTSNFHLVDNLTRSIRHGGRIIVDLIPKVYDTARAARIIGEEGEQEIIRINEEFMHKGQKVHYNLGVGKYDVSVDTGPSFATKRQEAAQSMLDLAKSTPTIMQVAPDLFVKALDIPNANEIAERLKKTLPPGIAEDKNKKPISPEVQAQISQMDQMIAQLTEQLKASSEIIDQKRMELESKERIEFKKLEVQLELKRAELDQAASSEIFAAEIAQINKRLEMLNIGQPIDTEINGAGPQGPAPMNNQPAGAMSLGAEEQMI